LVFVACVTVLALAGLVVTHFNTSTDELMRKDSGGDE
jgi:hypothetical protein